TGHAEVVQVTFDPRQVSYRDVLGVFFSVHDPTTLNRQGADVGSQYRSVIYYHSPEQQQIAEAFIGELTRDDVWGKPIVTEVAEAEVFYPAEEYHQEYFRRNPDQPYCSAVVGPKVSKFRKKYVEMLKAD
ncbi:MAG: peptide-methionine (S)-S-oxide reductase MsrA, partial [bacterium]|nr:peptide-methionine (S)-S-oxide reductase MsrA [Candidatus Kapabacteria bacterium]